MQRKLLPGLHLCKAVLPQPEKGKQTSSVQRCHPQPLVRRFFAPAASKKILCLRIHGSFQVALPKTMFPRPRTHNSLIRFEVRAPISGHSGTCGSLPDLQQQASNNSCFTNIRQLASMQVTGSSKQQSTGKHCLGTQRLLCRVNSNSHLLQVLAPISLIYWIPGCFPRRRHVRLYGDEEDEP